MLLVFRWAWHRVWVTGTAYGSLAPRMGYWPRVWVTGTAYGSLASHMGYGMNTTWPLPSNEGCRLGIVSFWMGMASCMGWVWAETGGETPVMGDSRGV